MATYWLGEGGNDGNAGTSYALRKLTTPAALALLVNKGDILNIVGTVDMETSNYEINAASLGNRGTSYSDPSLIIQGTDASGNPALATLQGSATNIGFLTLDDRVDYAIIRGLYIDMSSQPSSYNLYPLYFKGSGHFPVKIQYCVFEGKPGIAGAQSPYFPAALASYNVGQIAGIPEVLVEYCFFKNAHMAGDNSFRVHADHCVLYHVNEINANSPPPFVRALSSVQHRWIAAQMTNCTLDYQHLQPIDNQARHFQITIDDVRDNTADTGDNRSRQIHSNLLCVAASNLMTANQLWNSGMIDNIGGNITGTWSGTMGYNALVFGTNVITQVEPVTVVTYYENHFNPHQPTTTAGTNLYGTDVPLFRDVIESHINTSAAWTWTDAGGGGYDLPLEKDYRIVNTTLQTAAADGGIVGAVSDIINVDPTGQNQLYQTTENIDNLRNCASW